MVSVKCVILGNSTVGKTSILNSYFYDTSDETVDSTIGAVFVTKLFKNYFDEDVRLHMWDTAGQERYRSLVPMYLRGANIAILAYDISNRDSFDDLDKWLLSITQYSDIEIIIVANKADLRDTEYKGYLIPDIKGENYANNFNVKFFSVSAKTKQNISELFEYILNRGTELYNAKIKNKTSNEDIVNLDKNKDLEVNNDESYLSKAYTQSSKYIGENCCYN